MMSPARPNPRRTGAPPSLTPHVKPVISVEEWESKAPLSDLELRSVNMLKVASEKVPLPMKFSADDNLRGSPRPGTPNIRNRLGMASRPVTRNPNYSRNATSNSLHPKQPIQTPQQFYDWFAHIDRSVAHSQEGQFREHVATVSEHLQTCDIVIARVDEVEREVEGMLEGWRTVEEGGKSLKSACEKLLKERDSLLELTDDIEARLEYFQELDRATRMLNHPGESLVLQSEFLYMVERVDICIDYLREHRHYREAEVYLLRFQQCLTRAMTLIKMFFVGSLRALTGDVSKRMSGKDVSSTAQTHLLYTRFQSVSSQLSPLLAELERRAKAHPEELSALLSECYAAYFGARKSLLVGRLIEEIKGLDPARTELVELTRAGCSYLKQLCTDEFNLYRQFFSSGEDKLYHYLEALCDYLYDDLRPRILHEPRLTALCDVCTVLQALMVLDVSSAAGDDHSDPDIDDELVVDLDKPRRRGLDRLHISRLLQMVLQDAQTRLFFKAQSVIQSEIRYYVPRVEDLAYPDKIIAESKPGTGLEIREKESISQIFQLPSMDKQDTWFPTLQKTVWVLSQLHDFVKPAIFQEISQEAVTLCRQSLVASSEMIKSRNPPSSILDGQLFLVRHLIILKEITHNLDLAQQKESSADTPSAVTETFASMLTRTTSLLPDALFASLGMLWSEAGIQDAKHGLDHELKRSCENVISHCTGSICGPLNTWVDRVGGQSQVLRHGEQVEQWMQQPAVEELNKKFRLACERDLKAFVSRLKLYLEDVRTISVLVLHIQERIVDDYEVFRDVASGMYVALRSSLLSSGALRDVMKDICI